MADNARADLLNNGSRNDPFHQQLREQNSRLNKESVILSSSPLINLIVATTQDTENLIYPGSPQVVLYKPRGFVIWTEAVEYFSYSRGFLNYTFVSNLLR